MLKAIAGAAALGLVLITSPAPVAAQGRIKSMPGYEQYQRVSPLIPRSVRLGVVTTFWTDPTGAAFEYAVNGKRYRYDLASRTASEVDSPPPLPVQPPPATANVQPAETAMLSRGRGGDASVTSPDSAMRAFTRDGNLWLQTREAEPARQITRDGGPTSRIRNGTATYVYLEELAAGTSIWWSPDGRRIAFLRFDESKVENYVLQLGQTKTLSTALNQAYPTPGSPNPVPDVLIYDVSTRKTTRMDVRGGQPFSDGVVGHYVWNLAWTADGKEVLLRRAPRSQKLIELAACSAATGACRTVVREEWPNSWASVSAPTFLADGQRFIWASERTGFRNYYLYDLGGRQIAALTRHPFEVVSIVKVDEGAGVVWYLARSGDNHMKIQLHRVRLDGTGDERLTDPAFTHQVNVAPDGAFFVDIAQTHDQPPTSTLRDASGKAVTELARSDTTDFDKAGLQRVEMFTFKAADGVTTLHGMLHKPSNFDPTKTYPVLVSVYGGPGTNGASEVFARPNPLTEYGFLVVQLDSRTAAGRGKAFISAIYQAMGITEVDDQAAGVRALLERPYVDRGRIGVFGTSYGGTVSATLLMRYPDLFAAAVSNSPVTDYRLYDSTYPERYLGLPQDNPAAYDRAAVLTYAADLKGELMLYYGTSDDNVHPNNAMQLIKALQAAGKSFEVQVGPDRGHTAVSQDRMMEFFIDRLVLSKRS